MEEHTGRDANDDGAEHAPDAPWLSRLVADLSSADPHFLALLADEVSIPAMDLVLEPIHDVACPTCRTGDLCRRRARAKKSQYEYEIEAARAQIAQSEHELDAARAQVAEDKRLTLETLTALHDDWQTFTRAEQDRKEAEYAERFRGLLAVLGWDPERWLSFLLDKNDAHERRRPRLENEPGTPKLNLARQVLTIMRDEPRHHRLADIADRLGMIAFSDLVEDEENRKATDAAEAALRRYIKRFKELGLEL